MPPNTTLAVSLFFHLIATVIWIGGLLITIVMVWPEVRRTLAENPALYRLTDRLRKRFTSLSNLSLAVLIVTGLTQMSLSEHYNGFMDFGNEWSRVILLKHIAIVGMVISGVVLQYTVTPALERTSLMLEHGKNTIKGAKEGTKEEWEKLRNREIILTRLNALLGIAVLGFSAWAGSL